MRLPPLDYDTLDEEQRSVHDMLSSGPRGGVRAQFVALLRRPALARAAKELSDRVRYDNLLSDQAKEFAILVTAALWKAQYEWDAHLKLALKAGLLESYAEAIRDGNITTLPEELQLIYRFTKEIIVNKSVSDEIYDSIAERFGEEYMVDLIMTVGHYSMVAIFLNVMNYGITPLTERSE